MNNLANWLREQADYQNQNFNFGGNVPEVVAHVNQLREWAAELDRNDDIINAEKPQEPIEEPEESTLDDFHKHELMDRASFVLQILDILSEHRAHTQKTKEAFDKAMAAIYDLYQIAANECFDKDWE
jgi:thiamine biosynthesis lipoprotein ApbE